MDGQDPEATASGRWDALAKRDAAEARQALLLRFIDVLGLTTDPAEMRLAALRLLGEHLGLARIHYFDAEEAADGSWSHVIEHGYERDSDREKLVGRYAFGDTGSWMFKGFSRGDVIAVPDTGTHPGLSRAQRDACRAIGVAAFVSLPMRRNDAYVAGIGAHDTAPRVWTKTDVDLIREVAGRAWVAAERAHEEQTLRVHEAEQREALELRVTQATEELKDGLDLLGGVMEASRDWIEVLEAVRDEAGAIVDFRWVRTNAVSESKWGKVEGESLLNRNPGAVGEGIFAAFARVTETGIPEQHEPHRVHQPFDGWFHRSVTRFRDGVVTSTRDIDAWKAAEAEVLQLQGQSSLARLSECDDRIRTFVAAGGVSTYRLSPDGQLLYPLAGNALATTASPIRDWVSNLVPEDDRAEVTSAFQRAIETRSLFELEHRVRLADGCIGWVRSRAVPLIGADGEIREWLGACSDITDGMRAQERLRQSEAKYRSLFASMNEGLAITELVRSADGAVVDAHFLELNPAYERLTGFSRERALGRRASEIFPSFAAEWLEVCERVVRTGKPERFERFIAETDRWFVFHFTPLEGADMFAAFYDDITQRKRAETNLQQSQVELTAELANTKQLQTLSSLLVQGEDDALYEPILGAAMAIMKADFASIHVVDAPTGDLRLLGYRHFHPDSADFWKNISATASTSCGAALRKRERQISLASAIEDPVERGYCRLSGIESMQSTPLTARDGRVIGMISTYWRQPYTPKDADFRSFDVLVRQTADAFERSDAEKALRQSEARLSAALDSVPVGLAVMNAEGQSLISNAEFGRFLPSGLLPSRDPQGPSRWRGWDACGAPLAPQDFPGARALRGERVVPGQDMLFTNVDGKEIWTNVATAPVRDAANAVVGLVGVVSNVDDQKRTLEALRASEERLLQFGEASQDVLWIRDVETLQWAYLTPAFETIYGLGRDAALAGDTFSNWQGLILPEDREAAVAAIKRVAGGERVTFEYRIRRPSDGAIRWLRDTDFPIVDDNGNVILIGGIGHDFTDVREAELRFRTLVEGMPQLVWRAIEEGEWTWASPQWSAYTGQQKADYSGSGWLEALHPDDREGARSAWSRAAEQGGFDVEYRLRLQGDGEYHWFQTRAAPVRDHNGAVIEWLGTSTDIHDLRELQARQEVLVAELQHRTRNLIGVVRSTADKTARSSSDMSDFRARFRDRLDALSRVQGLLSRLNDHDRVTFDELIDTELAAMGGQAGRVEIDGPAGVRLRSTTVQTLAMALHELATNALKYGALAQNRGRLAITWRLGVVAYGEPPWLHIDWRESGVAMPPLGEGAQGSGQGRELIERALPYQLGARTSYVLGPDGVHCNISVPVSASTGDPTREPG